MQKLAPGEFKKLASAGHAIIDTRKPEVFMDGFIKGAVSIPFTENFLLGLDELISGDLNLLIVADVADVVPALKMLKGAGLENIAGYLDGGYEAWIEAGNSFDMIITVDEEEFAIDYQFDEFYLVDLRSREEFDKEHAEDAENIALIDVEQIILELENDLSYYLYGYEPSDAITAASIFKKHGFQRVRAVNAEYAKIKATNIPFFAEKKKAKTEGKFPHSDLSEN